MMRELGATRQGAGDDMTNLEDILQELKRGLEEIYGPRLIALYLYGSQARGDAEDDSDIDVAMVLDDYESPSHERVRFSRFRAGLCLDRGVVISITPIRRSAWGSGADPFLRSVRREGRPVA
jgi:predicted nucleotidyltransferase